MIQLILLTLVAVTTPLVGMESVSAHARLNVSAPAGREVLLTGGFAFNAGMQPTAKQPAQDALPESPALSATQTLTAGTATPAPDRTRTPGAAPSTPSAEKTPSATRLPESGNGGRGAATFVFLISTAAAAGIVGGVFVIATRTKRS